MSDAAQAPVQGAAESPALLLVDDDPLIVDSLSLLLDDEFAIHAAATRPAVRALLRRLPQIPSLALVDLGLPPRPHAPDEGFALIAELLGFNRAMKILVLSGQSNRDNIQHALTLGAVDFVPKPCDAALLRARLKHQLMILEAERPRAESGPVLLGESPAIETLKALIRQFASTPFPVLIEGESGSGKELVAQCLHRESARAAQPFVAVNCAAFTAELLEAQLFGHARGAFTGAAEARAGFFEEAGDGTLFLDEVGEFPLELQPKLLRVVESGEYYRVGETQPRTGRARIVAATNRDLRTEMRAGRFRPDLYHRLSVLTINVPPLRLRGDDRLLLLEHFRSIYASTVPPFRLLPGAVEALSHYGFPGNVRELRNIVIRLGAKYPGQDIDHAAVAAELETVIVADPDPALPRIGQEHAGVERELHSGGFNLDESLRAWERRYIDAALKECGGNLSRAARMLGVNRSTLYSRVERLKHEDGGA
ncbi:MAG: sigma-54-dependent Fis family transcriptional regulator [Gammaproteobacteria bacterium]|nr:sigma-54-dependent Fis family transcriptional regulator [Gammaproteobacteria bacterium]